jgi:alpha-2-macroglobulin
MIDHERALELAAAAFDFELSPADDETLTTHLETCESCRAIAEGMRADAVALVGLEREDAPDDLRRRIIGAVALPEAIDAMPASAPADRERGTLLWLPPRLRHPALLVAAAAVIVAVIGGTLAWRSAPSDGGVAVTNPSNTPSASGEPGGAGSSGAPGSPGPTNPPGPDNPELVTAWAPVAELTAQKTKGGVVDLDSGFLLAGLGGTSATELASHVTVQPALTLTATAEADGRVRLTPTESLTPGAVYQFTLAGDDGQTLDTWAFQARQPLRVVSTLPSDDEADIPLDTGIEVTFDQDGFVDAEAHMTIEPKVDGRFEQHDRVLAFVPERLAPATIYTVTVTRGISVEATGEMLEDDVRFQFETAAAGDAPHTETTFRFATDLFESAVAERPTISLWAFGDFSDDPDKEPNLPDSARLEVYRLPDQATAIDAFRQLRATPRWSHWNAMDRVPTAGLSRVAGIDAHLENAGGTLWTRLPEPLAAGWYLVEWPSSTARSQAVLQVTDVAGYLLVSGTRTLVWANDLASGDPIADATVNAEGATLGHTGADGTLVVDTPPALLPAQFEPCDPGCEPVVTVSAGGQAAFLPATGATNPDGREGDGIWWDSSFAAHPQYWRLFHTDRTRYRRTDTVNAWGMLRDRVTGKVPETVTIRLVVAFDDTAGGNAPIAQVEATPRPTGAFTGSLALEDVPEGSYLVELVADGEVITNDFIEVGRILKPAYRLDVVTGRRVYIAGDRIRVTATASFYEGTPVPGVRLRVSGFKDATPTTDATGSAIVRGSARLDGDYDHEDPDVQAVYVAPARAEEGEIEGGSREFIVFPSMWTVRADADIRGGRVRISGGVNVVDRDRLETEIADGKPVWDLDPRGAPVTDRTVTVAFTELIPVRTQTGTTYDFIEKRVVPVYEYDQRERAAGTLKLKTDDHGRFSGSIAASDADHDYSIKMTLTDPDGHQAIRTASASKGVPFQDQDASPFLSLTDEQADESAAFGVGDTVDVTMHEPGDTTTADGDRHLFYLAQSGLRKVVVRPSSRFVTTFPAWGPPNVEIGSVRFTGTGYVVGQGFEARFRAADRAMTVDLEPDKARYGPADEVTLRVRTRDADGHAVPATVVLRAIDEKLYSIGGASEDDPLAELYTLLDDGIRATYASHRIPRGRSDGADTGGGGDGEDFRDVVLFKAVDTGADGRASVTFRLSDDLTSWRVSGSAIGPGLEAGAGSTKIPVGLPFFVDAAIAPEYLLADRPAIQIRAFGSSLDPDARVTFSVEGDSLGLHESGLHAAAFDAITVPLPPLKLGTHKITITARTDSGDSARAYRLTRSFEVVGSRLTRTRTSYEELSGTSGAQGGSGLTDIVVSDAGAGRELPLLLDLASEGSARLERGLAADVAASLVAERFGGGDIDPSAVAFDGTEYQQQDGGIAILPYASSDLGVSTLAALVAPDRFNGQALRNYFRTIVEDATETRERRNFALAGLAGLGAPILPDMRVAAADPELTIRERLMLGLGAAALGDAGTARSIAGALVGAYGEAVGDQARLRVGEDNTDITDATALMAMLMAAIGDEVAPRYRAYVDANPNPEATYALHAAGYVERMLEHLSPQPASFAYEIGGKRRVVELKSGESFHLTVTRSQLATFSIERIDGAVGVTTSWREPVKATSFEDDPDVKIERTVSPSGTVNGSDLVVVDLRVSFGPNAAKGCHRVTELVPSGLVPVGILRALVDPETGEPVTGITYPDEQAGQRVVFCAEFDPARPIVQLRYVARVITVGTYEWEPTIVESRSGPDRAAIVPAREITIR